MPFQSEAQRRFMYAKHPGIAKRWTKEYGIPKNLPEHVRAKGDHMPLTSRALKRRRRSKKKS